METHYAPRCLADITEDTFGHIVAKAHDIADVEWLTRTAFPTACAAEDHVEQAQIKII